MKHWNSLTGCCLAVIVMFLISVSVAPAMAAEAINKEMDSNMALDTGMRSLSSLPVVENKKVLSNGNTRGISATKPVATPTPGGSDTDEMSTEAGVGVGVLVGLIGCAFLLGLLGTAAIVAIALAPGAGAAVVPVAVAMVVMAG